jgi:hypothetical protein
MQQLSLSTIRIFSTKRNLMYRFSWDRQLTLLLLEYWFSLSASESSLKLVSDFVIWRANNKNTQGTKETKSGFGDYLDVHQA